MKKWLIMAIMTLGLISLRISALLKWRSRALAGSSYGTLCFWCVVAPLTAFVLLFPAWALYHTMLDCMK